MKNANWLVRQLFYQHQSTSLDQLLSAAPESKTAAKYEENDSLYYNVLYVPQPHANMCVDASIAMVHNFFNEPIPSLTKNPRGILEDLEIPTTEFEEGFLSVDDLKLQLRQKGPMILCLPMKYDMGHAITCLGYTKNHFIYHDPLENSNKCIPFKELERLSDNKKMIQAAFYKKADEAYVQAKQEEPARNQPAKKINVKAAYAKFFSLSKDKDYDPCQAVINFLDDYANGSKLLRPFRKHRKAVNQFLDRVKKQENLTPETLTALVEENLSPVANKTKGSLDRRIKAIKTFIPSR